MGSTGELAKVSTRPLGSSAPAARALPSRMSWPWAGRLRIRTVSEVASERFASDPGMYTSTVDPAVLALSGRSDGAHTGELYS
eukprot:2038223-Prymnesium_polylepis.2